MNDEKPGGGIARAVKIILSCAILLTCLSLLVCCGKKEESGEPPAAAPTKVERERVLTIAPAERSETPVAAPTQEPGVPLYTLTYVAGENGSIDGLQSQTVSRGSDGSAVTAVPDANHHFVKWSDGSTANPRTEVNVTADATVTATFAVDQHTLAYNAGEKGSLTGAAMQRVNHGGVGTPVKAEPAEGYHFEKWSDGSTENPRTDANVTTDLAVTASFAVNRYTLSYTADPHGRIEGDATQEVEHGKAGRVVTAVAEKGHHFEVWSDGLTSAERIDSDVTGGIEVRALFAIDTWTVGGTVTGLVEDNTVVLQNNGGDDLTVAANGAFSFPTALPEGRPFKAGVLVHPTTPNQTCTVTGGEGTVRAANVTGIKVECKLNTYKVGGKVSGLPEGDQLVLRNNKGDDLVIPGNGEFSFSQALNDGSAYEVTIHSQKLTPKWFCLLENAAGKLAGSDVSNVDVACFREVELEAAPSLARVDLSWNSQDFPKATFNLCRALEEIPEGGFSRCAELKGGIHTEKVRNSPLPVTGLINDVTYWFQIEVVHSGGRRTVSKVVAATPFGGINDTGIDWCADSDSNRAVEGSRSDKAAFCQAVAATFPGQDAHRGRDALARDRKLAKKGRGPAGFEFTRVCANGEEAGKGNCPPNPTLGEGFNNWACTRDNVTGLLWEVKTTSGLRSEGHTYTWYNPDADLNGGEPGLAKGGRCTGSGCDTQAYAEAVNATGLCGGKDWRLPKRQELLSIVDNGRFKPAIDSGFFPHTPVGYYWSSSSYADQAGSAWQVYFLYGESYANSKNQPGHVRLVRPAQ